jgi:hypothetical protein
MYIRVENNILLIENDQILFCVQKSSEEPFDVIVFKRNGEAIIGKIKQFTLDKYAIYFITKDQWTNYKNNIDF